MKWPIIAACLALIIAVSGTVAVADAGVDRELRFEAGARNGRPSGWGGGPAETLFFDTETVHSGEGAARIQRDAGSEQAFTALTRALPADFQGARIELRGYLRSEAVTGQAGLWMRVDGDGGSLAFDNMGDRPVTGSTDWTEYHIELPLAEEAQEIFFGALLAGTGTLWIDDLELLVDGKPLAQAPARQVPVTILDTDTEFATGSGIEAADLTPGQVRNVARLGRVWGFVKYHHPAVAAGRFHWDFELFRVLPAVLAAGSEQAANDAVADWLERIGIPGDCDPCATPPTDLHLEPELAWTTDSGRLGDRLVGQLQRIHANRHAEGSQFYVAKQPGVGNSIFRHEPAYPEQRPPDAGYRLLGLLRLWNIIAYWFPYRDQIDGDWSEVLNEFVPRFAEAHDWDAYRLALFALITRIGEGHANLWSEIGVVPPRGECFLPATLRWVEEQAVVVSVSDGQRGGLAVGDIVRAVDGESMETLIAARRPYYSASNEAARMNLITGLMPRGPCTVARIEIERDGQRRLLEIERSGKSFAQPPPRDRPGPAFQLLSEDIAYLKLSAIALDEIDQYLERASGTRGLVIDIRAYPRAFSVFALGSRLIAEPTPFARFTQPDLANPGAFSWTDPLVLQPAKPGYDGRVAILVDEVSISQSEYTAMAFRVAPGALVIGNQTAGADGNVSAIPLPGGLRTQISGIGVFYPDKTPTQRIGIVPDIEVRPTVAGIRAGRDEVLQAAVAALSSD